MVCHHRIFRRIKRFRNRVIGMELSSMVCPDSPKAWQIAMKPSLSMRMIPVEEDIYALPQQAKRMNA